MFSELGLWFGVSHEFCKVLKCYYWKYFFAALFFSFWYSSYTLLCIKIASWLLNVLLCFYFSILFFFCLCISTLYVVLFSYSNSLIISSEIYLGVVNKYLFFVSVVVFFPTKKCQLGFWWGLLWFTFRQTRLSFLTLVRGLALCLFSSLLTSLSSILLLSVFRSFISLDRFIHNYLNCGAIANGIVALILIFNYLLQICKSMADFSILLYML